MANTAVTIARSKVSPIPLPERIHGFVRKFHIDYSDVNQGSGSTDTVTMTLGTTPANWIATRVLGVVTTAFAGTTAFTVSVGSAGSTNCILASGSVLTAGAVTNSGGVNTVNSVANSQGTSSTTLVAVFTNATGGSPSALSAGAMDIFVEYYDPTKIDGPINNT